MSGRGGRGRRRGGGPKRRGGGGFAGTPWAAAVAKVEREVHRIQKVLNPEVKLFDGAAVGTLLSTGGVGTVGCMSLIDTGLAYNNRNGESIKMAFIALRIKIQNAAAATVPGCSRVIIFADLEQRGVLPVFLDVLVSNDITSHYNHLNVRSNPEHKDRFHIFYDRVFRNTLTGDCATNFDAQTIETQRHIAFNGTGLLQATQDEGSVYYLIMTDVSANQPSISLSWRIGFYDN